MTDNPKIGAGAKGQTIHYSVGALIKRGEEYLLLDRANPPYGFAGVAGHVSEGEDVVEAIRREVKNESGLEIKDLLLLYHEEVPWNWCRYGILGHQWHLFACEVTGDLKPNEREAKSASWYTPAEIKNLKLEEVWAHWFKKLGII